MGLTFVPLTLLATTNVAHEDAGLASGIFNTSQQIGGALGLAILSTLAASRTASLVAQGVARPEALTDGYHVAFAVGAAFLAAGLGVLVVGIRKRDVESIDVGADDDDLIVELAA
jgi:sugar phosphate permease